MLFAQQQRLNIMNMIRGTFSKYQSVPIDRQKLISEICSQFGSTRRKASEYIRELLDSNFIIEVDGLLEIREKAKLSAEELKILEPALPMEPVERMEE